MSMQRLTTTPIEPTPAPATASEGETLLADLLQLSKYYEGRGLAEHDLSPAELRFIIALVRHQFIEPATSILSDRAQVMVFGGAGAGKSTTANILTGAPISEVNAQAGFTRHPVAVFIEMGNENWPASIGPLLRSLGSESSSLDEDKYTTRPIAEAIDPEFLQTHIVWDCPDLTSKDATYYEGRVIEIAALADVCVYVASDERYNDELPTNFLQAVVEAGKPTLCVLTKMSAYDVDEFLRMFREQVVHRLKESQRVEEIYAIPTPVMGKVADLWRESFLHGDHLRGCVRRLTKDFRIRRSKGRWRAANYILSRKARLLEPLHRDVGQWRLWVDQVRRSCNTACQRYQREYLDRTNSEDYQEARDALLAAFPMQGQMSRVWHVLEYLRAPYRMVKSLVGQYTDQQTTGPVVEDELLDRIRQQLLDSLAVAVAGRRGKGPLWESLHEALSHPESLESDGVFRSLRSKQQRDARTQRQDTYDRVGYQLSNNPRLLWILRSGRLGFDGMAAVVGGWIGYQLIGGTVAPLLGVLVALGAADDLVRVICQEYVRRDRQELLDRQRKHVEDLFRIAYLEQLIQLPKELGAKMQRLSELSDRVPRMLAILMERFRLENAE
jgi:energy-coupling factor transporter ATP-binding protein EcfA2